MVMQCVLFKSDIHLRQVSHLHKSNEKKAVAAEGSAENKSGSFRCNDMLRKMLNSNVKYLLLVENRSVLEQEKHILLTIAQFQ